MKFRFIVECEVNFTSGKFAARSDIADELTSELDNANPGSLSIGEGEYEVVDWSVSEEDVPKPKRVRRPRAKKVEAASAPTPAEWVELEGEQPDGTNA